MGPVPAARAQDTVVVVPCYNEAERFDAGAFEAFILKSPDVRFLFVDDGSTDETRSLLECLCSANPRSFDLLALDYNRGKAEAVRLGILSAAATGPAFVGFWDADLATPLDELPRLRAVFDERPDTLIVLGSRVNLLGRHVHRKLTRHYVGRLFATVVATALRLPVYDTQCGAKLFRCTEDVLDLFREPFFSKWIFDAELLARAIDSRGESGASEVSKIAFELPLLQWQDVDNSRLRMRHFLEAFRDAVRIYGRHVTIGRWYRGTRGWSDRVAHWVRGALSRLSTERKRVPIIEKVLRGAALVPIFGGLFVWTRARAWLLGPMQVDATARNGTNFVCELPDLIQTYLFLFGIWEPDLTEFIHRRLSPGDTFVDVGANIGYHSLVACNALGGDGRVVAIEASPVVFERLKEALVANGALGQVRAVNLAASDHRGDIVVYRGPIHNVGLSTTRETSGFTPEARVACAPLGDLLERDEIRTARLVKIDVEGGEDAVLRGMLALLDVCRNDLEILVELSPQWWTDRLLTPHDVLLPFLEAGFHVYEVDNNLWPWRYLWPNAVRRPHRYRGSLSKRVTRLDLVLSRVDADVL